MGFWVESGLEGAVQPAGSRIKMKQVLYVTIMIAAAAAIGVSCGVLQLIGPDRASGTEVCLGCRLEAEVVVTGGSRDVQKYNSSACSQWVAETGLKHQHSWKKVGCWKTRSSYVTRAGPGIWRGDWFEYLQGLSREELAEILSLDLEDPVVWERTKAECRKWRALETKTYDDSSSSASSDLDSERGARD